MGASGPFRVAVLLGAASGIRSMMGIAIVSWSAMSGEFALEETSLAGLSQPDVALAAVAMAAGEVALDKLPFLPSRTAPLPLLGRISLGALAGSSAYLAQGQPASTGALIGAGAAASSAVLTYHVRRFLTKTLRFPDVVAGLLGDAAALTLARRAMH